MHEEMKKVLKAGICSFVLAVICSICALESRAQTLPLQRCNTWDQVLFKDDQGRTIWLIEEGCSGFSNGADIALALSQPGGPKKIFFKFDDASWDADYNGQTTPSVKWISRDHLEVSIGAVAAILKKLDRIDGVHITYKIGHVLYK